jgi:hypothetical protein
MLEISLVLASLLAVGLAGLLATLLTPQLMTELGLWALALGLLTGVPTGLWYHVVLYRSLARKMPLPARWWMAPVDLHPRLTSEEIARIKPWFAAGGLGFILSLAGGLAAMAGLLLAS